MTQFNDWLVQLTQDGRGGPAAELPAISRGRGYAVEFELATHTEFTDWTAGTFSANLRASPDAASTIGVFTVTTGTPAGGVTPVQLTLSAAAQGDLPVDTDGNGIEYALYELVYTPPSSDAVAIAGGRIPITGAI